VNSFYKMSRNLLRKEALSKNYENISKSFEKYNEKKSVNTYVLCRNDFISFHFIVKLTHPVNCIIRIKIFSCNR